MLSDSPYWNAERHTYEDELNAFVQRTYTDKKEHSEMTDTMRDNSDHIISIGANVVATDRGDMVVGTVVALHPDRYFGTVDVLIETWDDVKRAVVKEVTREYLVEDVGVMASSVNCDIDDCDACAFDREMRRGMSGFGAEW